LLVKSKYNKGLLGERGEIEEKRAISLQPAYAQAKKLCETKKKVGCKPANYYTSELID
jgi:hypothetical protein